MSADPVLDTLLLPFREGELQWPNDGALFLRARDGAALHGIDRTSLVCEQSFKPDADALQRAGFAQLDDAARKYSLILILPPRQRDEARALFALALSRLEPGGRIVASASNNEGARSHEGDLAKLAGPTTTLSKNKCRVFWCTPATTRSALAGEWLALDAIRPIEGGRFVSRPGIFAWDRIDTASALLAKHLPATLTGRAADLGAGFGFLSVELLARCPNIAALDLYEAERRALDLARMNLKKARVPLEFHWHDVTSGLPRSYDVIVTNPPFHTQSRVERPDIGRRFIAVAAESLQPRGRLWLVANRHLPYESILNASFGTARIVAQEHGFKIIEAIKQ